MGGRAPLCDGILVPCVLDEAEELALSLDDAWASWRLGGGTPAVEALPASSGARGDVEVGGWGRSAWECIAGCEDEAVFQISGVLCVAVLILKLYICIRAPVPGYACFSMWYHDAVCLRPWGLRLWVLVIWRLVHGGFCVGLVYYTSTAAVKRCLSHDDAGKRCYGFLWIPMDSYGFLWIPTDSHGFLWIPMDSS